MNKSPLGPQNLMFLSVVQSSVSSHVPTEQGKLLQTSGNVSRHSDSPVDISNTHSVQSHNNLSVNNLDDSLGLQSPPPPHNDTSPKLTTSRGVTKKPQFISQSSMMLQQVSEKIKPKKILKASKSVFIDDYQSDQLSNATLESPVLFKEYKYRHAYKEDLNKISPPNNFGNNEKGILNHVPSALLKLALSGQRRGSRSLNEVSESNNSKLSIPNEGNPKFKPPLQLKGKAALLGLAPLETRPAKSLKSRKESSEDEIKIPSSRQRIRKIFKKGLYALYFIGIMFSFKNRVVLYGAIRPIEYYATVEAHKKPVVRKENLLPLLPMGTFNMVWTFFLCFLLLATAFITPVYVSFVNDNDLRFRYVNIVFDVGFGMDIVLNFVTAYYDLKKNLIMDLKQIAVNYLKLWFWVDMFAMLPIDTMNGIVTEDNSNSMSRVNKMLRLFRLLRIYNMFKAFKTLKATDMPLSNWLLNKALKKFNRHIHKINMLKLLLQFVFLNHIIGCLWFYSARSNNFSPDTWVAEADLLDKSLMAKYTASIYWAFETVTAVGYGDISPGTLHERIFSLSSMLIGVLMYSFAIANLSQLTSGLGIGTEDFRVRAHAFEDFSYHVNLPEFLKQKVKRFFELNYKERIYFYSDPKDTLKYLPAFLKTRVLLFSYYSIIKYVKLLQIDPNFTASLLVNMRMLRLKKDEVLYRQDDPSHEVYFISRGSVQFVTGTAKGIFSVSQGTYFGEIELLEGVKRRCFCQASENTILLICSKAAFLKSLEDFPGIKKQIEKILRTRKTQFEKKLMAIMAEEMSKRVRIRTRLQPLFRTHEYINGILFKSSKQPRAAKGARRIANRRYRTRSPQSSPKRGIRSRNSSTISRSSGTLIKLNPGLTEAASPKKKNLLLSPEDSPGGKKSIIKASVIGNANRTKEKDAKEVKFKKVTLSDYESTSELRLLYDNGMDSVRSTENKSISPPKESKLITTSNMKDVYFDILDQIDSGSTNRRKDASSRDSNTFRRMENTAENNGVIFEEALDSEDRTPTVKFAESNAGGSTKIRSHKTPFFVNNLLSLTSKKKKPKIVTYMPMMNRIATISEHKDSEEGIHTTE